MLNSKIFVKNIKFCLTFNFNKLFIYKRGSD
nr:MAG TPA: hypothetical protein [Caudoviricetes sp.]DAY07487.1 MAG TPA: hypothetical protein [Caudoviricetes sp.]